MMKQLAIFMCVAVMGVTSVFASSMQEMTLIYSGNTDGELEPCGCSAEGNFGGILRRATIIDKLRKVDPDLFLVSSGGLIASMSPQDQLTGQYIFKGVAAMNYDAIGIQWADLSYGENFLGNDALPWVSSNWLKDSFSKQQTIRHGQNTLAYFSWLNVASSPEKSQGLTERSVSDDAQYLASQLKRARQEGALTMLATTLTLKQAKEKLPMTLIDILVIRAAYEVYGEAQKINNTLVVQPGSRGMRLGHLKIVRDEEGRIASFEHKVITMPTSVPDAERLLDWYKAYNAEVKQSYLKRVAQRKAAEQGESPFVGETECKACHEDKHAIWRDTLHADAYYKLEDVNKAFDPNCIGCHTVGFEQPGGFIDMDVSSHLLGVQCESCHGAGRMHVKSDGQTPVPNNAWEPQKMCKQCHVQKHSPSFDFDRYWSRIKHSTK